MEEIYCGSPDMQMLLNLLVETEGIWAAILILSLFDGKFKNEFKVNMNKNIYISMLPHVKYEIRPRLVRTYLKL